MNIGSPRVRADAREIPMRYIPNSPAEQADLLREVGVASVDALSEITISKSRKDCASRTSSVLAR